MSPSSARPARSGGSCSRCSRRAASRPPRSSRSPRARSAGDELAGVGDGPAADRRDDQRLRHRALLRRRRRPRASGRRASSPPARSSSTTRAPGGWTRDVPLVVAEVNPEALDDGHSGHRRQPELLDDGDDAAAEGAARRLRPDARSSRRATRRPAAPGRRGSTSSPRRCPLLHEARESLIGDGAEAIAAIEHSRPRRPARLQRRAAARRGRRRRLHRRGAQARQRVAQDPRRSPTCASARPACACR